MKKFLTDIGNFTSSVIEHIISIYQHMIFFKTALRKRSAVCLRKRELFTVKRVTRVGLPQPLSLNLRGRGRGGIS